MGWNRAAQRYLLAQKFHALIKYSLKNPIKVLYVNVYKSIVILYTLDSWLERKYVTCTLPKVCHGRLRNFKILPQTRQYDNTQVPRYLIFCERGIFSAHALTLVCTMLTPYIGITLYMLP